MKKTVFLLWILLTLLLVLTSCRDTEQVMLDLTASDGGAGRETGGGSSVSAQPGDDTITVCLDPGHGFDDVGTDSDYLGDLSEKDITLAVTKLLADKLEALGYTVILTHDGESFPKTSADDGNNLFKPAERIAYADTLDIDLYVSVHCDSYAADESVKGTRIYYSLDTAHESDSAMAAGCVLRGINTALPEEKKAIIKAMENEAAYYVVRECKVPSVLIEMGFVSNRTDAENMLDPAWQDAFAGGIAAGVVSFFAE